jgi:hypothetical protein
LTHRAYSHRPCADSREKRNGLLSPSLTFPTFPRAVPADSWTSTASLSLETLPGRDLRPSELAGLAASIAAQPHLWEDKVGIQRRRTRLFASLHRDAIVDVG